MSKYMHVPADVGFDEERRLFLSSDQSNSLRNLKIPSHVAIIMDGNRRWAQQRGVSPVMGHWRGAEVLTDMVRVAAEMGIKTLMVYAFSTENWVRPTEEIEGLMDLFEAYLTQKKELMIREGIRLNAIGDIQKLPNRVQAALEETRSATRLNERINLVLAMNYGGRDEIRRAMVKILKENEQKKIDPETITESIIAQHLDTSPWGDPDLVIRTSGEVRMSNFLLWQISYSEIYITDVMWPDFGVEDLLQAIRSYQSRKRRMGAQ